MLQSPRAGRLARTPAVSPDGRRIIFQVQRDGTWIADATFRRDAARILDDPTAEEFTWAPDGRQRRVPQPSHRRVERLADDALS